MSQMARLKQRPKPGYPKGHTMIDMGIDARDELNALKRGKDTHYTVVMRLIKHYKSCPRVGKE